MAKDTGTDLGTVNVLIYVQGKGIVLNEPSVVAVDIKTNKVLVVGSEAYRMVGRTPSNIRATRPLKDGVISDLDVTQEMPPYFISKLNVKGFTSKLNIVVYAPTNTTEIERKAIIQAAEQSGGGKVYLEYKPKVAAIGAGLDIFKPRGNMVIDMGGGTSDIVILSLSDTVSGQSTRMAGDKVNSDIASYIKNRHGLVISEHTAEKIKMELGTALRVDDSETMDVRGRGVTAGMPKQITVNENEIEEALHGTLEQIISAAVSVLEIVPLELASDITGRGIMLTGGTSLLKGVDRLFSARLKVPAVVSQDPLDNVVKGAGEMLERMQKTERKK